MTRRQWLVAVVLGVVLVTAGAIQLHGTIWPLANVADRIRGSGDPIVVGVDYYQPNILNKILDGGQDYVTVRIVRGTTMATANQFWCDVVLPAVGTASALRSGPSEVRRGPAGRSDPLPSRIRSAPPRCPPIDPRSLDGDPAPGPHHPSNPQVAIQLHEVGALADGEPAAVGDAEERQRVAARRRRRRPAASVPAATSFRTAVSSARTEPASVVVPASVTRSPTTSTSRPPICPRPSPVPASATASLTSTSRSAGLRRVMSDHSAGWTWMPSAMSST